MKFFKASVFKLALAGTFAFLSAGSAMAQCLTSSLDITTGVYNGSVVGAGNHDPNWKISGKSGNFVGNPPVGSNAYMVTKHSAWVGGGNWLCDTQLHASPGIVTTMTSSLTFQRTFKLCQDDQVTFNLNMRSDGFIKSIKIDGVSTGLVQTVGNWMTGSSIWSPGAFSQSLSAGTHTIEFYVEEPPQNQLDPLGFYNNGSISTTGNSIVDDQNPNCADYVCGGQTNCDLQCYWRLNGNSGVTGTNFLGTVNNEDLRIRTSNTQRAVFDQNFGYFGLNTPAPTAQLHVNCQQLAGNPSDVRFENLPFGRGSILVIDPAGHVFRTEQQARPAAEQADFDALKAELAQLKSELTSLKQSLQIQKASAQAADIIISPNPATTTLQVDIKGSVNGVDYRVTDAAGRTVANCKGCLTSASQSISIAQLPAGNYHISFSENGKDLGAKTFTVQR